MSGPAAVVVLLSVRPPHVDRLLDGTKTVELRRRAWRVPPGAVILLYASGQKRALVGSLVVAAIETGTLDGIWDQHGGDAGLTRQEFDTYFLGAHQAVAICVGSARRLETPVGLGELRRRVPSFTAPQTFRYVIPYELAQILNGEREALLGRVH